METKPSYNNILGIDIGGSHISAALVNIDTCLIQEGSFTRNRVKSDGTAEEILNDWQEAIEVCISSQEVKSSFRVALAMPGPFDYENGISLIKDLHKYESLYGVNVKQALSERLNIASNDICFRNDAEAFLAGEIRANGYSEELKTLGITLGTGLGSALSEYGVTRDANFAMLPFLDAVAEEYLSTRWFVSRFKSLTNQEVADVKTMLSQSDYQKEIAQIFEEFTQNLFDFLSEIMDKENYQTLIIGGNISKTSDRFLEKLSSLLHQKNSNLAIHLANLGEASAIIGASLLFTPLETTTNL